MNRFKAVALMAALTALPSTVAGQVHDHEVFAGFARLSIESDEGLESQATGGLHLAWYRRLVGRWGTVLDVSVNHGTIELPTATYGTAEVERSNVLLLAGVRRNGFRGRRLRLAFRAQAGVSIGSIEESTATPLDVEGTAFAGAIGGAVMVDLNDRLTLRLIQPTFMLTTHGGGVQFTRRLSVGLAWKSR